MITLHPNDDGSFAEKDTDGVTWVRDRYTKPREFLFLCEVCGKDIEEWDLFTCLDGGEAAHVTCIQIESSTPEGIA